MSYEPPIRPQRRRLTPERLVERIDILLESASIVEDSIRDLVSEVYIDDPVLEKIQYAISLSRRQISCLERAKRSAEELGERKIFSRLT